MQKKLPDYIKALVDKKEHLGDFYEPEALLVQDEGVLICGLLVSLNIVDCNLCLKEEDLDNQEAVIDLSYYLRRKEDIGRDDSIEEVEEKDINTVIDQKNYIEEMNRSLGASVTNLQARVESLTNTNALMREDLAISKRRALGLEQEQERLKQEVESLSNIANLTKAAQEMERPQSPALSEKDQDAQQELEKESRRRQELEKELKLEGMMKAEIEMAMKLLEKDVHEKQDTIVTLRAQLEDIKTINLEMYTKLAECEKSLTYKSDLIQVCLALDAFISLDNVKFTFSVIASILTPKFDPTLPLFLVLRYQASIFQRLEGKSLAMADTLQQLDAKFVESERNCQVE